MVLCSQRFTVFVEYAGVKDRFDASVDEPLYMAVRQLCGGNIPIRMGLTPSQARRSFGEKGG